MPSEKLSTLIIDSTQHLKLFHNYRRARTDLISIESVDRYSTISRRNSDIAAKVFDFSVKGVVTRVTNL
jgi:hypothetical protein